MKTKPYSFISVFSVQIDAKRRMSVPASFRDAARGLGITLSFGLHAKKPALIFGSEESVINVLTEGQNDNDPAAHRAMAPFLRRIRLDNDGRCIITQEALAHLGFDPEQERKHRVMGIGRSDHFEVMTPEHWERGRKEFMASRGADLKLG